MHPITIPTIGIILTITCAAVDGVGIVNSFSMIFIK